MSAVAPLFAVDFGSIATVIVTVVGLVIYAINQVLEVQKMNPPNPPGRGMPGRQMDPFGNPNANRPRPGQRPEEVDAYLRDVTARTPPNQPPRRPPPPRPDPPRQQRPSTQSGSGGSSLGSLEKQHSIEERAKQFSQRVSGDVSTDDVKPTIEKHVQSSFSHQVGTLAAGAESEAAMSGNAPPRDATSALAGDLRALLANPRSLQQAIILQEILNPPTHRWE